MQPGTEAFSSGSNRSLGSNWLLHRATISTSAKDVMPKRVPSSRNLKTEEEEIQGTSIEQDLLNPQTVVVMVQVPDAGLGPEFWCLPDPGVIVKAAPEGGVTVTVGASQNPTAPGA